MDFPTTPDELAAQGMESTALKDLLKDSSRWHSIPLLNYTPLHKLKDQTLVRFRGMIQDMMDPEIFLERYEVKSPDGSKRLQDGKFRDCLRLAPGEEIDYNAEGNVHGERRTLFVVSVPGLNDWSKHHEKQCGPQMELFTGQAQSPGSAAKKRSLEEQEGMDVGTDTDEGTLKRQRLEKITGSEVASASAPSLGSEYLINSPLPDRPSMACMVKVYEDFDAYQLNSLVDFVGFLSVDPSLDAATLDVEGYESLSELQAAHPSPFLIPRLHAFGVKVLPHANPLLDESLRQPPEACEEPNTSQLTVHKDLRMLLKLCLFDDDLAAEYLLSHLISTVYSRTEMQSIGKFALNLCNLPKESVQEYTTKLYQVLELLLPVSHYLPMTLDLMNTAAFAPK